MVIGPEFFFQSYNKCFRNEIFFVLFKCYSFKFTRMFSAYNEKSFVPAFLRSTFTFSLEKEIIVLEKSLEEDLNFGSKNFVRILY